MKKINRNQTIWGDEVKTSGFISTQRDRERKRVNMRATRKGSRRLRGEEEGSPLGGLREGKSLPAFIRQKAGKRE